jgi:nitrile hydratase
MDGVHDLGGRQGFGPVQFASDESAFHARWEGRVFAMVQSAFGVGAFINVDHFRHTIERIAPVAYLEDGYYGRWLGALETALVEAALLQADQVSRRAARPASPPERFERGDGPAHGARVLETAPAHAVGQVVRTATHGKPGHTRLPGYARGRVGVVTALHGGWVFPDTHAHGQGEQPEHLYTVRFSGSELWGADCDDGVEVCLDLFESYLEAQ